MGSGLHCRGNTYLVSVERFTLFSSLLKNQLRIYTQLSQNRLVLALMKISERSSSTFSLIFYVLLPYLKQAVARISGHIAARSLGSSMDMVSASSSSRHQCKQVHLRFLVTFPFHIRGYYLHLSNKNLHSLQSSLALIYREATVSAPDCRVGFLCPSDYK